MSAQTVRVLEGRQFQTGQLSASGPFPANLHLHASDHVVVRVLSSATRASSRPPKFSRRAVPYARMSADHTVATGVADHTVGTGLALLAAQAPLEPGQLLEDVRLTVRGILRARRDHSASISFLELSDSSTDEAGQLLQVCINRAKCDETPSTRHALEQLNIGDTLCCSGPPGRTRTVPDRHSNLVPTYLCRLADPCPPRAMSGPRRADAVRPIDRDRARDP